MLIRSLPTILLQIFCDLTLHSESIVKSVGDLDDNIVLHTFLGMDGLTTLIRPASRDWSVIEMTRN